MKRIRLFHALNRRASTTPSIHSPTPDQTRTRFSQQTMMSDRAKRFALIAVLHVVVVVAFGLSLFSGLHISADQRPWFAAWSQWLPGIHAPHQWHLVAAILWLAIVLLYVLLAYRRARTHRNNPSAVAAVNLRPASAQRWIQMLYVSLSLLLLSGTLLWLGSRYSHEIRFVHFCAMAALLTTMIGHICSQYGLGKWRQLWRVWPRWHFTTARFFLWTTITLGLIAGALHQVQDGQKLTAIFVDQSVHDNEIVIDGLLSENAWNLAPEVTVQSYYGDDLSRVVPIHVKAMHDGYSLYLSVRWPDPSKSMTHLPLIKSADGWQVQHNGFAQFDERVFYEDKLALMLSNDRWGAFRSVFLSKKKNVDSDGNPSTNSARGGHLVADGELLDIWHWKSVRNAGFANLDDSFFGPFLPNLPGQKRYTNGYSADPVLAGGYLENWHFFRSDTVTPLRLPREASLLRPYQENNGDTPLGMYWHDTMPYDVALDNFPIGTVLPSVLWNFANEGDRADVRAVGTWANGEWQLELARTFQTESRYDITIEEAIYLWLATFDHSQIRHSYHLRPLKLSLEKRP